MKQLGLGFNLFLGDHEDMYPPSAYSTGPYLYQLTWDDYIHKFIGGTDSEADLALGITATNAVPKVLQCPADRIKVPPGQWYSDIGQRRTYAMNYAGSVNSRTGNLPG